MYSYISFILQIYKCVNLFLTSFISFFLWPILSVIHYSPRNSFTKYLRKVSTPLNILFLKAIVVLFLITLKLGADNPSHNFLAHHVNVHIIIRVLVLLSQFVSCVISIMSLSMTIYLTLF